jgi:hypothetical protein
MVPQTKRLQGEKREKKKGRKKKERKKKGKLVYVLN